MSRGDSPSSSGWGRVRKRLDPRHISPVRARDRVHDAPEFVGSFAVSARERRTPPLVTAEGRLRRQPSRRAPGTEDLLERRYHTRRKPRADPPRQRHVIDTFRVAQPQEPGESSRLRRGQAAGVGVGFERVHDGVISSSMAII